MDYLQERQQQRTGTPFEYPQQEWQVYKVEDGVPSPETKLRYRSAFSLFLKYCRQTDHFLLIQQILNLSSLKSLATLISYPKKSIMLEDQSAPLSVQFYTSSR
jgi:hypothetical protein